MDKKHFIDLIVRYLREPTLDDVVENLVEPPGRHPSSEDIELSSWYKELCSKDREMVAKIIRESVDEALFGFLCILDGVRSIFANEESGIELNYMEGGQKTLLNGMDGDFLHDLYKAEK